MGFVIHDLKCVECEAEEYDAGVEIGSLPPCEKCGGAMEIRWDISQRKRQHRPTALTGDEKTVVYVDPRTGNVAYPGRNDRPMEARYVNAGYERVEFSTLREVDKFCKERNLMNERANFDRNGKADQL